MSDTSHLTGLEIAVIGMAGRYPGSNNVQEFWENIRNGVESIQFYSDQQLEDVGVPPEVYNHPAYVKTEGGLLECIEYFDAAFFAYTPVEAEMLDPQVRLFHECAWEALEDAGYDPDTYTRLIGLFGGAEDNTQWRAKVLLSGKDGSTEFTRIFLSCKDFVCSRVSYKMNLKGPSVAVSTGCSTALVSIHMACRNLLSGECDMALAGGVNIQIPTNRGYMYQEGMLNSADGHVHAFDDRASGTVFSSGIGIVALKVLDDAMADRDHIYAVIKGSAVNNDGLRKVNFSAPSVKGQVAVIRSAYKMAGIDPVSICYVETHGTGTPLGDPIEINALKQAFNLDPQHKVAIGSVKTNIGHTDVAAGISGFIKAVMAVKHRLMPPSLNYKNPNPKLDLDNSPFYVNTQLNELLPKGNIVRVAVSSFGFGGTNAHVIIEEAPQARPSSDGRPYQLLKVSAKSKVSLAQTAQKYIRYLSQNPDINFADVAYTLSVGRQDFTHRSTLVTPDVAGAIDLLSFVADESKRENAPETVNFFTAKTTNPTVVFMFSGQGSQYVNMGLQLFQHETVFRTQLERCFELLVPLIGYDLKTVLYPGTILDMDEAGEKVNHIYNSGPIKFSFEYAMGKQLLAWGIRPDAVIGHSFGEYAASCLAGVFSLEDALQLVVLRGRLMSKTPEDGVMLGITASGQQVQPFLSDQIDVAALNSELHCIVSGPEAAVATLEEKLAKEGIESIRINFPRAAHSHMMDSILAEFEEKVKQVTFHEPTVPYICGLTGNWAADGEPATPSYWVRHLRETVRFADGIGKLFKNPHCIFIQVGPDRGLPLFVKQHPEFSNNNRVINMCRYAKEETTDMAHLVSQLSALWVRGVNIDWSAFYADQTRNRLSLPTYAFDSKRFWVDVDPYEVLAKQFAAQPSLSKQTDVREWLYRSTWKKYTPPAFPLHDLESPAHILIFNDANGFASGLDTLMRDQGHNVTNVMIGETFKVEGSGLFYVNPTRQEDYVSLFKILKQREQLPRMIFHLWSLDSREPIDLHNYDRTMDNAYYSLINIAHACGELVITDDFGIKVVTDNMQGVLGNDILKPGKAAILGAVKVIPLEYPNITCQSIDIDYNVTNHPTASLAALKMIARLASDWSQQVLACRGNSYWVPTFEAMSKNDKPPAPPCLKEYGVYLVTGGLAGIGLVLARHLAKEYKAKLVLIGRSTLPPMEEWPQWLESHDKEDNTSLKIQAVRELEGFGATVLVGCADVSDLDQMQSIVTRAKQEFGNIDGVIHSAGLVDFAGVIQMRTREMTEAVLAPKIKGTLVLDHITRDHSLDFFFLCSSLATVVPAFGEVGYIAANDFLNAFAIYKNQVDGVFCVSANWDTWQEVGAAVNALKKKTNEQKSSRIQLQDGILSDEGAQAFLCMLEADDPHVLVSTKNLMVLLEHIRKLKEDNTAELGAEEEVDDLQENEDRLLPRPELPSAYVAPGNDTEKILATVWKTYFGIREVGIADDFFQLGGDSLMATVLSAKIHKKLNVRIPLVEIFQGPTIAEMARYIKSQTGEDHFSPVQAAEKREYYPLSAAQKRLYILQHADPSGIDYNVPMMTTLTGVLDKQNLEKAIVTLLKRHESLRTSFVQVEGVTVQRIVDFEDIDFSIRYVQAAAGDAEKIQREFIRPFDLEKAPLLRVKIIHIDAAEHVLMADVHHIISDGASLSFFVDEFMKLYDGEQLEPLKLQYKDYSQWQNLPDQLEILVRQEHFWLQTFAQEVPLLNLPLDFERPLEPTAQGRTLQFFIEKEDTTQLKKLAREHDATLFMILMAIYTTFLYKVCNQEDIVVATPVMNRRHEDLMAVMGVFVNTVLIRSFPHSDLSFEDFLIQIRDTSLNVFENQDYQFGDLIEKVKFKRHPNRNPMFDTVFQLQNIEFSEIEMEGAELTESGVQETTSKLDLHLTGMEQGDGLFFALSFKTHLFHEESVNRFIHYFKKIVTTVVQTPNLKLSDIELTTGEKKEEIIDQFCDELEED
jgi:acyl transferase domain-containing protein/acyl carrier protein